MIPSRFHVVDSLPRTHSGKVDRRKLAESVPDEIARDEALLRPRDEVEEQLATIWEDLLQIRPIGVRDDFFELGGHSLLAVRLAARIEERFGRSLALSDLLLGSTIEELADGFAQRPASRGATSLVNLGASGPGWPLYLVHPIGGGVICYNALARGFDGRRGVLGLQAAGYEDDEEPETDLVRMASGYVDAIRADRPGGPYILGGWSMGGIVAFEMANQLVAAGHDVPLVILIDCSVPVPRYAPHAIGDLEGAGGLRRRPGTDRGRRQRGGADHRRDRREAAAAASRRLSGESVGARRLPASRYLGPCHPGPGGSEAEQPRSKPTGGWKALAPGGISTHLLPGDHYTIMQRPTVLRLAEILAGEIERHEQTAKEEPVR